MSIADLVKDEALVADAYERVKADLAGVPAEQLEKVNLDVQTATRTILGALPEIRALRARIVQELPKFDIGAFDKLEDYVQTLKYAQSGYQIATEPNDEMVELTEAGNAMRQRLLADANALAVYKLFDGSQLERLKGGNGLDNLAEDLELLSRAMLASWPKIQGKALTPLEEVQTASRVGLRLTRLAGLRDQGPARLAAAVELRQRAFYLVSRTYEEVRDAIRFLRRREGDLEDIAPTLYTGKGRRPTPEAATTPDATTPGAAATGAATPGATTTAALGGNLGTPLPGAIPAVKSGGASKDPFMP